MHTLLASLGLVATALAAPQQCPVPLGAPFATPSGEFGFDVAIDGDLAVVSDSNPCSFSASCVGAAFVYRFEPISGAWNYEAPLHRLGQSYLDVTGTALDVDGDTIVVGSIGAYHPGGVRSGAVTVWDFDGTSWVEGQTLYPADLQPDGRFGESLDLEGDVLVVGNDHVGWDEFGSVVLFRRDASGTWTEDATLEPRTRSTAHGFGYAVRIAEEQVLVTAIVGQGHGGDPVGAVIVFEEDPASGAWVGVQRLVGSTGHALFGRQLALDGDRLAVASHNRLGSLNGPLTAGAAFLFERDPGTRRWSETQRLSSDAIQPVDSFGHSVALDGPRLYVGEFFHEVYILRQRTPGGPFERSPYRLFEGSTAPGGSAGLGHRIVADSGHVLAIGWNYQANLYSAWAFEGDALADCDDDLFDDDCALALGWLPDLDGDGTIDTCGGLGTRICFGRENSTERPTRLVLLGSDVVADDDLLLRVVGMRPHWSGYFLVSDSIGFVPRAGGSEGDLCIAGPRVGRFSNSVVTASQAGSAELRISPGALPQPAGAVAALPGDTWYFQFWHRDQRLGGGTTSTFSDAVGLTFR